MLLSVCGVRRCPDARLRYLKLLFYFAASISHFDAARTSPWLIMLHALFTFVVKQAPLRQNIHAHPLLLSMQICRLVTHLNFLSQPRTARIGHRSCPFLLAASRCEGTQSYIWLHLCICAFAGSRHFCRHAHEHMFSFISSYRLRVRQARILRVHFVSLCLCVCVCVCVFVCVCVCVCECV
jgi:hypothetical protein